MTITMLASASLGLSSLELHRALQNSNGEGIQQQYEYGDGGDSDDNKNNVWTIIFWICVAFGSVFGFFLARMMILDLCFERRQRQRQRFMHQRNLMTAATIQEHPPPNVDFVHVLKATTSTVTANDILTSEILGDNEDTRPGDIEEGGEKYDLESNGAESGNGHKVLDEEDDDEECNTLLLLPNNSSTHPNNSQKQRKVPGQCAICLNAYQVDDQVSWSSCNIVLGKDDNSGPDAPPGGCSHVFHTDCIVQHANRCLGQQWKHHVRNSSFSTMTTETLEEKPITVVVDCPMCRSPFLQWQPSQRPLPPRQPVQVTSP